MASSQPSLPLGSRTNKTRSRTERARVRMRWQRALAVVLLFFFSAGCGWSLAWLLDQKGINPVEIAGIAFDSGSAQASTLPARLNVLLIGDDRRPEEGRARSDTIIVASFDRTAGRAVLISVPRDTRVYIPGHGPDKINAAYALGGVELTRQVVSALLGIEIPYYVTADFEGFRKAIDALGGVTLEVERRMYYPEEDIDLYPGLQRLDGRNALAYVRFRHYPNGDVDRTEHQRRFLLALAQEVMQPRTLTRLPQLLPVVLQHVHTNLTLSQVLELAALAPQVDLSQVTAMTLPGSFLDLPGVSYWMVDAKKVRETVSTFLQEPPAVGG